MEVESRDISEYVESVVKGVSGGIPQGFRLSGRIGFKLAVVKQETAEGSIRILVANARGEYTGGTVSTIEFGVEEAKGGEAGGVVIARS
jgi:hypothetical protein